MFTKLHIKGFKCWQDTGEMPLAPLTLLFGPNSGGKSALLQFLLMLKQTVESTDQQQALDLSDRRNSTPLGSFKDLIFQHQLETPLEWWLEWQAPKGKTFSAKDPERRGNQLFDTEMLGIRAQVQGQQREGMHVNYFRYYLPKSGECFGVRRDEKQRQYMLDVKLEDFRPKRTQGRSWPLPAPGKFYRFPDQAATYYQNTGFLPVFEEALEAQLRNTFYLAPLREFPRREYSWSGEHPEDVGVAGENTIAAMLAARQEEMYGSLSKRRKITTDQRVARWLAKIGLLSEFKIEEVASGSGLYQVKIKKHPGSAEALLPDVGFGISQLLPVLTLCFYAPPGTCLLLEHPELHLHPSAQAELADALIQAVQRRGVQLIVESHSEHLLRRLQRRIAEEVISPESVRSYFCVHDEISGASELRPLKINQYGDVENWPEDFFGDQFGEIFKHTKSRIALIKKERQEQKAS